jgi:hypothetical protein
MFDTDALNAAVSGAFCNKAATWTSGAVSMPVQVAVTIAPVYDEQGFQIAGESISAGCLHSAVSTMQRGDTLTVDAVVYEVMAMQHDGAGWATITLEKQ